MISGKKKEVRVRELRRRGLEFVAQDQFAKAAQVYIRLTELEPEEGDWARRAADCFWQLKDDRERFKYSVVAAEAYCDGGFLLKAIAMCKVVLSLDPDHKETQERLGRLYAKGPLALNTSASDSIKTVTVESVDPVRSSRRGEAAVVVKSSPAEPRDAPKRDARRERARLAAAAALRQIRAQRQAQKDSFLESASSPASKMPEPESVDAPLSLGLPVTEPPNTGPPSTPPAPSLHAISLRARLPSIALSLRPEHPQAVHCIELGQLPPLPEIGQYLTDQSAPPTSLPHPSELFEPRMIEPDDDGNDISSETGSDLLPPTHLSLSPVSPAPSIFAQFENIPLFSALSYSTLIDLINQLELVELTPGQVLFRRGDPAEAMYVITDGSIHAEFETPSGSSIVLEELNEGDFFGEIGLLSDQPRQALVRAQNHCRLLCLQRNVVARLMETDPTFLLTLVEFLRQRLVAHLLQTSPLFAVLPEDERRDLAERFDFLEIDEDTALLEPGQRPAGMYVLLAGSALAFGTKGRSRLTRLEPGAIFGEGPLLRNETSDMEVVTTSKCFALCLAADKFRVLMMTHPPVLAYVSSLEPMVEDGPYLGDHVTLY